MSATTTEHVFNNLVIRNERSGVKTIVGNKYRVSLFPESDRYGCFYSCFGYNVLRASNIQTCYIYTASGLCDHLQITDFSKIMIIEQWSKRRSWQK